MSTEPTTRSGALSIENQGPEVSSTRLMVDGAIVGRIPAFSLSVVGGHVPELQVLAVPEAVDVHFRVVEGSPQYIGKVLRVVTEEYDEEVEEGSAPTTFKNVRRFTRAKILDGDTALPDVAVVRVFASSDNTMIRGEVYTYDDYMSRISEMKAATQVTAATEEDAA